MHACMSKGAGWGSLERNWGRGWRWEENSESCHADGCMVEDELDRWIRGECDVICWLDDMNVLR